MKLRSLIECFALTQQIGHVPLAEAILDIGFDPSDRERMTQLMEMAKDGELSSEQVEELEHYRHIGRLLELMKSRARRSLQNT